MAVAEAEQPLEVGFDPALLVQVRKVRVDHLAEPGPGGGGIVGTGDPGTVPDHFADRPEGDVVAVGGGATLVPVDVADEAVDVLLELPDEAALADARLADDRDESGPLFALGGVELVLEHA